MPELGPYMPDLPPHGHDGLVLARNTYFLEGGYKPVKGLSAFTAALSETWRGGGYFKGTGGNTALLAGTDAGLYSYASSAWTSEHADTYSNPWFFAQFGNDIICVNGAAPLAYDLGAGTAAALGGSPPACSMVAIVDPGFVFVAGNSSATNTVYWSGLEDAAGWTIGTNQSDVQELPDGGPITGLAGGEYAVVFQESGITLFTYEGGSIIFSRRKVSREIGCLTHGSIAQAGSKTFFLDRRGFYMYQPGGDPVPIGKFRVDRSFLDNYTISDIQNGLRASVDPDRSLVIWSMPDRLWIYNWAQDRWTDVVITGILGVSTGAGASATLESIAILFPSIEDVTPNLDDPFWSGGSAVLLVAKTDGILYSFGGDNMEATFKLPSVEQFGGREAHIRNVRLIGDVSACTTSIDTRRKLGDTPVNVTSSVIRDNGDIPIRASGRYQQVQFAIPQGHAWSYVQAYDVESTPGGRL